jgi:hypothetical protein
MSINKDTTLLDTPAIQLPIAKEKYEKQQGNLPDIIDVGPLVSLCVVEVVAKVFRMGIRQAANFLEALGIPLLYLGRRRYFNLYSLRYSLFITLHPGGISFSAPGSYAAHNPEKYPKALKELNKESLSILQAFSQDWNIEVLREALSYSNIRRAGIKLNEKMQTTTSRSVQTLQDIVSLQEKSKKRVK